MDGKNHTIEERVDSNKTIVEITNLLHNAKYYARVSVCNNRYDGPTSELIYFDTPEGGNSYYNIWFTRYEMRNMSDSRLYVEN